MRSVFNISKALFSYEPLKSVYFQASKMQDLLPRKLKIQERKHYIDVASHEKFLQEQRLCFEHQVIKHKANDRQSRFKYLGFNKVNRCRMHKIGSTYFMCKKFSTEKEEMYQRKISTGGDFSKAVNDQTIFVDKSLFIKEIIEDAAEVILITMPRRWGKSLNLDMLRRFLSIEDHNIKRNTQLDIFKTEIKLISNKTKLKALDLQGTYPVIYVDFQYCSKSTIQTVKYYLKQAIIEAIEKFQHLELSKKIYRGNTTIGQKYKKILSQAYSGQINLALRKLSQLLQIYYEKKVWVLIDEYDSAANRVYLEHQSADAQAIADLFRDVLHPALKGNPHLEKGVITGIQYILKSGVLSGMNNIQKYNFTSTKYSKYYGIDQRQMQKLLKQVGIKDEEKILQIKEWYNGYKQNRGSNESPNFIDKYNIWSVMRYLKNQERFQSYWEQNRSIENILNQNILNNEAIRNKLEDLINGKRLTLATFTRDFQVQDFQVLKAILNQVKILTGGADLFFSYLVIIGYLTQTPKQNCFILPNKEMKEQFKKKLTKYYQKLTMIQLAEIKKLTQELNLIFIQQRNEEIKRIFTQSFKPKFQALIQKFTIYHKDDVSGLQGNENLWHSFLNFIAIQIPDAKFATERYITKPDQKRRRADIYIFKNGICMIIQVKYQITKKNPEKLIQQSLVQAKEYNELAKEARKKIFIACVITSQKTIHIDLEIDPNNN